MFWPATAWQAFSSPVLRHFTAAFNFPTQLSIMQTGNLIWILPPSNTVSAQSWLRLPVMSAVPDGSAHIHDVLLSHWWYVILGKTTSQNNLQNLENPAKHVFFFYFCLFFVLQVIKMRYCGITIQTFGEICFSLLRTSSLWWYSCFYFCFLLRWRVWDFWFSYQYKTPSRL